MRQNCFGSLAAAKFRSLLSGGATLSSVQWTINSGRGLMRAITSDGRIRPTSIPVRSRTIDTVSGAKGNDGSPIKCSKLLRMAAAGDSRIKAVLDDSAFSDAPAAIRSSFEHFIGLPSFPFAPLTVSIVRLRTGIDVSRIRPADVIARISPRPLLIVHCMDDKVARPDNSERNFAAAKEPKQFWRIPSGGHVNGLKAAGGNAPELFRLFGRREV